MAKVTMIGQDGYSLRPGAAGESSSDSLLRDNVLSQIQRSAPTLQAPPGDEGKPRHHLIVVDDAANFIDARPSLQDAVLELTELLSCLRLENAAAAPRARVSLLLRIPAGCDWSLARRPTQASLSLRGLLLSSADGILRPAPLASGFSRDFNGRITLTIRAGSTLGAAAPLLVPETDAKAAHDDKRGPSLDSLREGGSSSHSSRLGTVGSSGAANAIVSKSVFPRNGLTRSGLFRITDSGVEFLLSAA